MERTRAAQSRRSSQGLNPFERFVETTNARVSRAPFFFVCLAIVVLWAVSLPIWHDTKTWQAVIHTIASVISILLLVLLENSGRRHQEAQEEKLNVIAEALAALMDSRAVEDRDLGAASRRLREAVGLEERH